MDLLVVFAAIPLVFYLLPAVVPIWRPFLMIWLLLGGCVIAIWLSGPWGPFASNEPRGLGAAIDLFINIAITICWCTAALVQGVRWYARRNRWNEYRHWLAVAIGFLAIVPMVLVWA